LFVFLPRRPLMSVVSTPPPPRTRLWPYTTLFRSPTKYHGIRRSDLRGSAPVACDVVVWIVIILSPARWHAISGRIIRPVRLFRTDRKSTRLNSSHVKISYAIFCLKQKK